MQEEEIIKDTEETLKILEKLYDTWLVMCKNRLKNLKKVNVESLAKFVKLGYENGKISKKEDLVTYIETIIQD